MLNAFIESFDGRHRDELLNETLFTSLAQARVAPTPVATTTQPSKSNSRSEFRIGSNLRQGHLLLSTDEQILPAFRAV